MNVAIFGAAGAIGPVVAAELIARGHTVRAVGRDRARLSAALPRAEAFAADLSDPSAARAAADGMDAVLYTVGVPYDRFDMHVPLMRTTLEAARNAGVRALIEISNVYPYGRPQTARVSETHPLAPHTRKGAWRKEQEDVVLAAHDPAGLATLVLRLPDFYGPSVANGLMTMALASILAGKTVNMLAPVSTEHEWVYVPDVAPVVADLFEKPHAFGTAYNLAGAGTMTSLAFVQKLAAAAGKPLRHVAAGPLVLRVMGLFDPMPRELVEMAYLHETPVFLDDAKLRGELGTLRTTSYDDGIRATVAASTVEAVPA